MFKQRLKEIAEEQIKTWLETIDLKIPTYERDCVLLHGREREDSCGQPHLVGTLSFVDDVDHDEVYIGVTLLTYLALASKLILKGHLTLFWSFRNTVQY